MTLSRLINTTSICKSAATKAATYFAMTGRYDQGLTCILRITCPFGEVLKDMLKRHLWSLNISGGTNIVVSSVHKIFYGAELVHTLIRSFTE